MRELYDSVDVRNLQNADIPADALIGGYVDGRWATFPTLHHSFPNHRLVSITVTGELSGIVGDAERYDMTPQSAARWAQRERSAGRHPTIYMSESQWQACKDAVHALGMDPAHDVSWWVAWEGHEGIPDGAVACQNRLDVNGVDISDVADYWPGVDPAPAPEEPTQHHTPATPPVQEGWTAQMIQNLPVLRQGATGPDVRTAQACLVARGHNIAIDGDFGNATDDAVHALQAGEGIAVDGAVGRDTWTVLITGRRP